MVVAGERVRLHWVGALADAPELGALTDGLPENRMSAPAKAFATALYMSNRSSLSHALRTMME